MAESAHDCPGGEVACPRNSTVCSEGYEDILCGNTERVTQLHAPFSMLTVQMRVGVCSDGFKSSASGGLQLCVKCPSSEGSSLLAFFGAVAVLFALGTHLNHGITNPYTRMCCILSRTVRQNHSQIRPQTWRRIFYSCQGPCLLLRGV